MIVSNLSMMELRPTCTSSIFKNFTPPFSKTTRKFVYNKPYFFITRNLVGKKRVSFQLYQPVNKSFLWKFYVIERNLIAFKNRSRFRPTSRLVSKQVSLSPISRARPAIVCSNNQTFVSNHLVSSLLVAQHPRRPPLLHRGVGCYCLCPLKKPTYSDTNLHGV